ncbi:MAG: phosphoglucosamine mutase [Myxococcota bacterium]|nr:phosphoglucosamine mutase [Myxococcota bacterium]
MGRELFGTDGIRGVANRAPMTADLALRVGAAVGVRLREQLGRAPKVVIGKDTRRSCYVIEYALVSGLCAAGARVYLAGVLPTPGVAFLTTSRRADAGVMISASHNPFQDNGIKLFASDGYKLPDEEELALEGLILKDDLLSTLPTGESLGRAWRIDDARGRYNVAAKRAFPTDLSLSGVKIVVDCANGAGFRVAPEVLRELGAKIVLVGAEPNGININADVGATAPRTLAARVLQEGAMLGFALDGDGDRCLLVDERGQPLDGDQLLAILGRRMHEAGTLRGGELVATVMSNLGLHAAMKRCGVKVSTVQVGDRYVVERMRRENLNLGGEQSGHLILRDFATTGDGLVSMLALLGVMVREEQPLSRLAMEMERYPQRLSSVDVLEKPALEGFPLIQEALADANSSLGDEGRVLLRYSGTQMQVRLMVEGREERLISTLEGQLLDAIRASLPVT